MQRQLVLNNNNIICEILKKEEEFEDELNKLLIPKLRNSFNSLVSTRKTEGFFKQLIGGHLFKNKIKFREFFLENCEQFHFILSLIKEDLTKEPTMRVPEPISPDKKLTVTLR